MQRREFITLLGGAAAAWPLAAQQPAMPVVGFLNVASAQSHAQQVAAFRKGLQEAGYFEGQNVTIEYRWAERQFDRLPAMAADLVRRQVAVIAATTTPAALAAKAATTTIPIIFELGSDPVKLGLVASLSRPGSNVTGVTQLSVEVAPKRLELLHQLIPTAKTMALLVDPADSTLAAAQSSLISAAAQSLGIELHVVTASTDFDAIFAKQSAHALSSLHSYFHHTQRLTQLRAGGLVMSGGAFFLGRQKQLGELSLHHAMPAVSETRDFAVAGGLMSYGADIRDAYRLAGIYTGGFSRVTNPLTCQFSRPLKSSSTST
jgi:ABC transporter substrate binding protein